MTVISLRHAVLTPMPHRSARKVAILYIPEKNALRFKQQPELNWRGIANYVFVLGLKDQSHCSRTDITKFLTEKGRGHPPITFFYPSLDEPSLSSWSKWICAKIETSRIDTLILNIGSENVVGLVKGIKEVWSNNNQKRELHFVDGQTIK